MDTWNGFLQLISSTYPSYLLAFIHVYFQVIFKPGMCRPVASVHAWFLEISFVCDVCMCACVPPPL